VRIAFVTDELPRPGAAGHLAFNFALITWLQSQGHDVEIVFTGSRLAWPMERYGLAPVAGPHVRGRRGRVFAASPRAALAALARAGGRQLPAGLRASLSNRRHQADAVLGAYISLADAAWCAGHMAGGGFGAILVDTMFRAHVLDDARLARSNSVIIAHDVFHRRHAALRSAGFSLRPRELTAADEARQLGFARHIAAIQPEEARILRELCPAQNVFTAGMPATPCPPWPEHTRQPGRLIFIGSASLPNLDGLRWFFAEIWPGLIRRGYTLDLVGDCGGALRNLPPSVTCHGRVPEIAPLLHNAALAIAPLRVGSGLKIKLLDYARHGLTTVATPASLTGFAADDEAPFIAADDAAGFTQAIIDGLATPPPAAWAINYVIRHYGIAASFTGLAEALGP